MRNSKNSKPKKWPRGYQTLCYFENEITPVATCPLGWSEVDSGFVGSDNERVNTRTCMTYDSCKVLTVTQHQNNEPKTCPEAWEEADFGLVEDQDMERGCYLCAS